MKCRHIVTSRVGDGRIYCPTCQRYLTEHIMTKNAAAAIVAEAMADPNRRTRRARLLSRLLAAYGFSEMRSDRGIRYSVLGDPPNTDNFAGISRR